MGAFDYGNNAAITKYTQTAVLQTSQTISVPPGTKRIEALLCGGGGGGGTNCGGGFGGLQIYSIPVTGSALALVVGTGGIANARGGTTAVSSDGILRAAVGGGGAGSNAVVSSCGIFGGSGGGTSGAINIGVGGAPFSTNYLWSALDVLARTGTQAGSLLSLASPYGCANLGTGALAGVVNAGVDGASGYGGGGNYTSPNVGGGSTTTNSGGLGGGGGPGGSLATLSIWGLTGFVGGTQNGSYGGGGGGVLGAGANAVPATNGGAGGNGGGGGGGGTSPGAGGNGFAMFRFYS